ncbi:caspase recruitment domain-containing protein 8-like [Centroberyx affinis]|uniref:caspase recruitment domain-containing protein 8-like n=1 Tax=Centroberyx affinis TaxID=166261 RepID=UPI003A5C60D2
MRVVSRLNASQGRWKSVRVGKSSNGCAERAVRVFKEGIKKMGEGSVETKLSRFLFKYRSTPQTHGLNSSDNQVCDATDHGSTCCPSINPVVAGPPCPPISPVGLQSSPISTEGDTVKDACRYVCLDSVSESGDRHDAQEEMLSQITAGHHSTTDTMSSSISTEESPVEDAREELLSEMEQVGNHDAPGQIVPQATTGHPSTVDILPVHSHLHLSCSSLDPLWSSLPHSHSMPSLSQDPITKNNKYTRAMRSHSLPDILLQDSYERFTPDIAVHENKETYRFQCTYPGLYQCRVTGLVFNMEGEGDVVYRTVPWNQRLLARYSKKPAGPLFDIKCHQQSVCQLHLPHCEIRSAGGCEFLSVAHVTDEGTEFILPHKITETHVIMNITGFSDFGNVKDENSPPVPIRALVLLFYNPPVDPDLTSFLNMLLLPGNIVLRDVLNGRRERNKDERFIEISSRCKLHPEQEYTLSTSPEDDSILIQPKEAEFYSESDNNYFPTFQVVLEKFMKNIKLLLKHSNDPQCVWERQVCLSSDALRKPQVQSGLSLPSNERLFYIRSSFIDGISGPVLKSLLDKLFEKTVITDSERESADEMQMKSDKARFVIDAVRKKGEAASSEMIAILCEVDPFLCGDFGLI